MNPIDIDALWYSVQPHFWSPRKSILRGVSLSVAPGELFGFLGPNGAGKTTTIKVLLGLIAPQSGTVRIFGRSPADVAVRRRLGFMPERAYFPEHLSAYELLSLHGVLAGLSWGRARLRAHAVLDLVGLTSATHERLAGLSKGMQQRVGLGQALIGEPEPELVILDEPMSGLDPVGRRDVRELMLRLSAASKTVFFSTHILPDVEAICQRVAILVGGQVRRIERLDELLTGTAASIEVQAEGCSERARIAAASLACQSTRRSGTDLFMASDSEAANRIIDLLRSEQARIVAVQTQRRSLEDIFVAASRSAPPSPAPGTGGAATPDKQRGVANAGNAAGADASGNAASSGCTGCTS